MLFDYLAYADGPAAGAAAQGGAMGGLMSFLPIIIIFVIFYFLLIRPQQKRQKQHQAMINALKSGDTVITNAGIEGKISSVDGNYIYVEVANGVILKMVKGYIADKVDTSVQQGGQITESKENK